MARKPGSCALVAQTALANQSRDARRDNPDPQDRLVRRVGKVGIPHLLEFRTQLGQFRWLRAPFDPRVDTADIAVSERKVGKKELDDLDARRPFLVLVNSAVAAVVKIS
jgi:hypothetical protein